MRRRARTAAVPEQKACESGNSGADFRQINDDMIPFSEDVFRMCRIPRRYKADERRLIRITSVLENELKIPHPGGVLIEVDIKLDGSEFIQVHVMNVVPVLHVRQSESAVAVGTE